MIFIDQIFEACTMDVTLKFEHYDGGVYSEKLKHPPYLNHEISVLGWGVDETSGKEYWIGRNSWGKKCIYLAKNSFLIFAPQLHRNLLGRIWLF